MFLASMTKMEFASFIKDTLNDVINEHKKVLQNLLPTNDLEYCTIISLTEKFKVTKATIHNWAKRGTIKKYKINGRTLYRLKEVEKIFD